MERKRKKKELRGINQVHVSMTSCVLSYKWYIQILSQTLARTWSRSFVYAHRPDWGLRELTYQSKLELPKCYVDMWNIYNEMIACWILWRHLFHYKSLLTIELSSKNVVSPGDYRDGVFLSTGNYMYIHTYSAINILLRKSLSFEAIARILIRYQDTRMIRIILSIGPRHIDV